MTNCCRDVSGSLAECLCVCVSGFLGVSLLRVACDIHRMIHVASGHYSRQAGFTSLLFFSVRILFSFLVFGFYITDHIPFWCSTVFRGLTFVTWGWVFVFNVSFCSVIEANPAALCWSYIHICMPVCVCVCVLQIHTHRG